MAQMPFHESIVDLMDNPTAINANCFVAICKLIETTKVPKGHEDIELALGKLAESGGHQYMDEFLDAIRALQLGAEVRRSDYHELYELADGTSVGVMGAMHYILDERGERVNDGFHQYVRLGNGVFAGKLGATMQILRDGQPISEGFHNIEAANYGYLVSVGSLVVKLDKDGQELMESIPKKKPWWRF